MRFGHQIPKFAYTETAGLSAWLREVAQAADESGFYSLWVMDHFFQLGGWLGEAEEPMLEGYSAISYLAGVTERIKLGLLVTGVIYRYPAVLLKTVTTLDVLSGGRAYFGIGAAWFEHEAESLGLPYPSLKERFEWLEEVLQLAHHVWDGPTEEAFEGEHFQLPYPYFNPQPLSDPHPPILIGGMGEQKTLRFVAEYGDACNLFGRAEPDVLQHKLDVLKGHCEDVGRPYEEIEKTILDTVELDKLDETEAKWQRFEEMGFDQIMFNIDGEYDGDTLRELAERFM